MLFNTEIIRKTDSGFKRASQIEDGPQWLSELKARMRKEKKVAEVIYLSPSRARALLGANAHNRKISNKAAVTYAADIINGRWSFNGEPIIVAETGELNDGQHRCEAVILAGIGIETLLVAGVTRDSRTTVDMGKARTTGDFLTMHQIENGNNVAAAANILYSYENGLVMEGDVKNARDVTNGSNRPTKQAILTFARANMADIQRAMKAISPHNAGLVSSYSRFVGALCIIARRAKNWAGATDYLTAVIDGDGLSKGSIEYIVRQRLLTEKSNRQLGVSRFLEIVIRGWNAKRSGQPITRLTTNGTVPQVAR